MGNKIIPKKENKNKGFYYDVTDEQIREHQQRSIDEIFEWIESANMFISTVQTQEEKRRAERIKGKY